MREKYIYFNLFHVIYLLDTTMIYQSTKDKINQLLQAYQELKKQHESALIEIAVAEIPEMVYNSNAIENSTLTLKDTEEILIYNQIKRNYNLREVYEAKNLAYITEQLLHIPNQKLTTDLILDLHKSLLM